MRLARLALSNPYLVIVSALGLALVGWVAITKTPVDLLPRFNTPAVQILTLYPGMPANVVEQDITNRLERWTGQANGVARQESRSMLGVSVVRDYFRPDIDANTAMSQVSSLAISDLYYLPPGTVPPMVMPFDPTAPFPFALLTVASPERNEKELYDIAYFQLRNLLQGIPGAIAPAVYGGRLRRILVYLDRERLQARNLSPMDVVGALRAHNVLIPTGDAKIGNLDYQIVANGMLPTIDELNDIPIRMDHGAPVYVRDIGHAEDTSQIQSNIVRVDGRRQVYIPIYRQPGANTLDVVNGIRRETSRLLSRLPQGIHLNLAFDQSAFVRTAIRSLVDEMSLGGALAALMVLVFLGSLRSTGVVFLSIPLSMLVALVGLYFTGNTINAMTLGGLALAVGRLVDDSIVVLENSIRHLRMGKAAPAAALDAAAEVGLPVLVATLATIIVFFPVVFLTGIGQFLFTPLALTVAFAMAGSYVVSMTVVPVFAAHVLRPGTADRNRAERLSEALADRYARWLAQLMPYRAWVIGGSLLAFGASWVLYPRIGQELMTGSDTGQFTVLVHAPTGTRIERTEDLVARVEAEVRRVIPSRELGTVISNIGVLYDWPAAYTPNAGPGDALVQVQLGDERTHATAEYVNVLRRALSEDFPGTEFSFDTGGLLSAALNFGLPAPINVQVEGNDLRVAHQLAGQVAEAARSVPGAIDVRVPERSDYPVIQLDLDRTRVATLGLTTADVVKNIVTTLNSSVNFDPAFWIDEQNGNHYFVGAQYREQHIRDLATLRDIPLTGAHQSTSVLLGNIAEFRRGQAESEYRHLNIRRVVDVFMNVAGRDVGSAAADLEQRLAGLHVPAGYQVSMRGEVQSMRESFQSLGFSFLLATALIYLLLVAQFRSFGDPLIILAAVPLGLVGVLAMLFVTRTTLNVQSFMGIIFMVGISVSNSVLLVDFANRLRAAGRTAVEAAVEAARVRVRPILMTSVAAILGLVPMALELDRGSEANGPLGRAVIGGLMASTFLVLVVVPALHATFRRERDA